MTGCLLGSIARVPPSIPSWGAALNEATSYYRVAWWTMLFPEETVTTIYDASEAYRERGVPRYNDFREEMRMPRIRRRQGLAARVGDAEEGFEDKLAQPRHVERVGGGVARRWRQRDAVPRAAEVERHVAFLLGHRRRVFAHVERAFQRVEKRLRALRQRFDDAVVGEDPKLRRGKERGGEEGDLVVR